MNVFRKKSPLLDPYGNNKHKTIKDVVSKAGLAVKELIDMWDSSSIKEILLAAHKHKIINVTEHLEEHLERDKRIGEYDDENEEHQKYKSDWLIDELFAMGTTELATYREFILDLTPFNTQHGVKGEEFRKVLVVYDDTEAGWNNFNYERLFAPLAAGKEVTDGQRKRGLNLAYVCFSRTEEDLRIIMFVKNPESVRKELIDRGVFKEEQVKIDDSVVIPNATHNDTCVWPVRIP